MLQIHSVLSFGNCFASTIFQFLKTNFILTAPNLDLSRSVICIFWVFIFRTVLIVPANNCDLPFLSIRTWCLKRLLHLLSLGLKINGSEIIKLTWWRIIRIFISITNFPKNKILGLKWIRYRTTDFENAILFEVLVLHWKFSFSILRLLEFVGF